MLIAILFLGISLMVVGLKAAIDSLRSLPHSNEDWVWY
jgi:hypothetical protein